jgi:hypothetical protein
MKAGRTDADWRRDYLREARELAAQEDDDEQQRCDEDRRWSGGIGEEAAA